ncbi:hypothetical protein [Microbacterium oleivorans]|uniref:Uncharacterized protein n=1 Tax=Microbacterium oleivorans TaxID=273677 RepID=A0A4R5YJU3_9MICO|nr:hypothetical protein [Microbacterium oleivorans]TDL45239.1 hypothetical protein E2R54_01865 [Microbacterium oleivorans]
MKYANAEVQGNHAYNPQVVDRRLQLTEAGASRVEEGYFRYTYSWNSFWERTIPVRLATSVGALTFGNDGAYAPDVDYVVIAPVRVGQVVTAAG